MLGWLLLFLIAFLVAWYGWVFFARPASDLERIKADHAGTDAQVVKIERVGMRLVRPEVTWVGGHVVEKSGVGWFRIYLVTLAYPGGFDRTYEVGVEARPFGYRHLKRFE